VNPADDETSTAGGVRERRPRRPDLTDHHESWLLRTGLSVTVWLLAGVATFLAASGQIQFAHWVGITDLRAYAVPAVLELVAIAFLLLGYRRARRGDSPGAMWLLAAGIGAFAVYTNVSHSGRAGLVFGAASAITLVLWFVKLRDDYHHFQRYTGQATRPKPKFGALWLVAPRLTARAWVVAARRRISTVDESVAYAEVWRAVYEDSRTAKVRRMLARRTAWRSVAEAAGGVWAELPRTAEVAAVDVIRRGQGPEPGSLEGPRIERQAVAAAAPTFPDPPTPVNGSSHPQLPSAPRSSLRDRVFALLDEQFSTEEALDIDDDDPYVLWMTSRALSVDADDVADFVREWRRQAASRVRVQAPR
jgi:hypothetical protein